MVQVVAECYVKGVSGRRVGGLIRTFGIDGSRSRRSPPSRSHSMRPWRRSGTGPLDRGPCTYLWLDALEIRCREAGRMCSVAAALATAVNWSGQKGILGLDILINKGGWGWTQFLRGLVARGVLYEEGPVIKQVTEAVGPWIVRGALLISLSPPRGGPGWVGARSGGPSQSRVVIRPEPYASGLPERTVRYG